MRTKEDQINEWVREAAEKFADQVAHHEAHGEFDEIAAREEAETAIEELENRD